MKVKIMTEGDKIREHTEELEGMVDELADKTLDLEEKLDKAEGEICDLEEDLLEKVYCDKCEALIKLRS